FRQTPMLINPALTGNFNGAFRGIVNYRNQWASIGSPYKTYAFSFDMGILKKKMGNKYLSAGLFVYKDIAGDTKLSTTQVNFSLSSSIPINNMQRIIAGIQGGFAQKSIDASKMEWGSQYEGNAYNPGLLSGEINSYENDVYSDFSVGMAWQYGKGSNTMSSHDQLVVNTGIAVYHINKPVQEFDEENLHQKIVLHGSATIGIANTNINLVPNFLILKQGPLGEINLGGLMRYTLSEESKYTGFLKESAVLMGGSYRLGDAFIPTIMLEISNFLIGFSYDLTVSGLTEISNGNGGLELSLQFINLNSTVSGKSSGNQPHSLF
ncbi:MAG TPA: type IX secretion system membrane protein PorP/SprF, partial [Flavobacteriales bacterium]|nr:type IX secretion system membrane protein PorP/SprF [Flavobacteriales bacterium]